MPYNNMSTQKVCFFFFYTKAPVLSISSCQTTCLHLLLWILAFKGLMWTHTKHTNTEVEKWLQLLQSSDSVQSHCHQWNLLNLNVIKVHYGIWTLFVTPKHILTHYRVEWLYISLIAGPYYIHQFKLKIILW